MGALLARTLNIGDMKINHLVNFRRVQQLDKGRDRQCW